MLCILGLGMVSSAPSDSYSAQAASVQYTHATLFGGLLDELAGCADEIMDNRWSVSSMRTIRTALSHWQTVALRYGWDEVTPTDDPGRGGKLVAFVMHLLDKTELVAEPIGSYQWWRCVAGTDGGEWATAKMAIRQRSLPSLLPPLFLQPRPRVHRRERRGDAQARGKLKAHCTQKA